MSRVVVMLPSRLASLVRSMAQQSGKILIAEDDKDLLEIYNLLLKHDGYR